MVPGTERVTVRAGEVADELEVVPGLDAAADYAVGLPRVPLADAATEPEVRYLGPRGRDMTPACGPRQPCFGVLVAPPPPPPPVIMQNRSPAPLR